MKIAVLGATGETGVEFIRQAATRGHHVTALARSADKLAEFRDISVVEGDATDHVSVERVLAGQDAVFSTLGLSAAGGNAEAVSVCTEAMRLVVPSMERSGISRLVAISTYGVNSSRGVSPYADHLWSLMGERLIDKETMEPLIESSSLDWTIVRCPRITDEPASGDFRVGELILQLGASIPREDLVTFVLGEFDSSRHVGETLSIAV